MKPIGKYANLVSGKDFTEYIADDPPAVLLHKVPGGILGLKTGYLATILNRLDSSVHGSVLAGWGETPPKEFSHLVAELRSAKWSDSTRLLIGAAAKSDIEVPSPSISPEHGWVLRRGDEYAILAIDEETGIWVCRNKLRPGRERVLRPGDPVRLGVLDFIFLDATGFYHFARQHLGR
ncbi:MAG: FHA domain-containing protein [bacterium]